MGDEPKRRGWVYWTLAVLLTSLLYVLSIGPMFWLVVHTGLPTFLEKPANYFYLPVFWPCDHSPTYRSAFKAYVKLWAPAVAGEWERAERAGDFD